MEGLTFWYLAVVCGVFISACSQIILKKSAERTYRNAFLEFINWRVASAYIIFLGTLIMNVSAMHYGVKLKDLPILEALGYIFVPFLSLIFLKEKISRKNYLAMSFIIAGIFVFYL